MYNINIVWNMLNCMTFIFWMHLIISIDARLRWILLFLFITLPVSWLIVGTPLINDLQSNTFKPWLWHQLYDHNFNIRFQFSSVAQSCPTLCDPMNRSTPGLPVHHQLPEFTQTHVHQVGDAIQPSQPLSSPSPPALNPSQHQSLFQWVNSSHEVAKVLEFQL